MRMPVRLAVLSLMMASLLAGCGKKDEPALVGFGEAPPARRMEFAKAVVEKLKGHDDLGGPKVVIEIKDAGGMPLVTLHDSGEFPRAFEHAISVVLTNVSFKYPGIGFMAIGDGGWKLLMPNDMRIPLEGDFGLK